MTHALALTASWMPFSNGNPYGTLMAPSVGEPVAASTVGVGEQAIGNSLAFISASLFGDPLINTGRFTSNLDVFLHRTGSAGGIISTECNIESINFTYQMITPSGNASLSVNNFFADAQPTFALNGIQQLTSNNISTYVTQSAALYQGFFNVAPFYGIWGQASDGHTSGTLQLTPGYFLVQTTSSYMQVTASAVNIATPNSSVTLSNTGSAILTPNSTLTLGNTGVLITAVDGNPSHVGELFVEPTQLFGGFPSGSIQALNSGITIQHAVTGSNSFIRSIEVWDQGLIIGGTLYPGQAVLNVPSGPADIFLTDFQAQATILKLTGDASGGEVVLHYPFYLGGFSFMKFLDCSAMNINSGQNIWIQLQSLGSPKFCGMSNTLQKVWMWCDGTNFF